MRLANVIQETVNSKYHIYQNPTINDHEINTYVDYNNPIGLYDYIDHSDQFVLSPNSKNFIQGTKEVPILNFLELASNKYDVNFDAIYNIGYTIDVIGYGGFMSNMIHFMDLIKEHQNYGRRNIIKLKIYEDDDFSAMNNVRTFQDTMQSYNTRDDNKLGLLPTNNYRDKTLFRVQRIYEDKFKSPSPNKLYIGSPDFDTRQKLEGHNFLFFGNSNSDFVIHKSPVIDPTMTRETYGKINIIEFWVGILEATYAFLHILENNLIGELPHNTEIWSKNIQEKDSLKKYGARPEQQTTHRASADEWTTF